MLTKTIFLPTNLNNKLHNKAIVHIDRAPWSSITERMMDANVIEFRTQDDSYPPSRWKLVDLYTAPFMKMYNCITWPSHGMDQADFYVWLKKIHPDLNSETPMAAFYYEKISE